MATVLQTDPPTTTSGATANAKGKRPAKMASQQNLNHLLNFTLPPRQANTLAGVPRRSKKSSAHSAVWNKERFVNAQYRFVMKPTGDYTVHFADPDIFFQWQDILQVIIPRTSALASAGAPLAQESASEGHTTCPICLSPPSAPRMTKCGHVFCFPCILHYLSTSDNLKWVRCPICFDSVNEKQLKAVKWFDGPPPTEDETEEPIAEASSSASTGHQLATPLPGTYLHMRLIQRPSITTLALPRSSTWPSDLVPPHQAPFHFLPDVFAFSKFMLATPAYLIEDLSRDLDDLASERRMLSGMRDDLSVSFVDAADAKVRKQLEKAAALDTEYLRVNIDNALRTQKERESFVTHPQKEATQPTESILDAPEEFLALQSPGTHTVSSPSINTQNSTLGSRNPRQRRNLNPPPPSTSTYYYYQAASGAPIFLHPLDIKVLHSHYGTYPAFPDSIRVRVEAAAEGTVNDDLRRRCKYLAHLPEGADVVFVESDLMAVVGAEGLKSFEGPLKMRRSRRKEKGKKDDKARARAEEKEREKLAASVPELSRAWSNVGAAAAAADGAGTGERWETIPAHLLADGDGAPSVDEVTVDDGVAQPSQTPAAPGAWGSRSFASALHSTAPSTRPQGRHARGVVHDDEWDMEVAWDELATRASGGGRSKKQKGKKLVLLGGGGGRQR